ncbi:hypothetical protein NDU88_003790 [Pleurodeles waltl]|uniref:Uncharacterized protein n=1 Tax=Pleurodeles waltl TaxID=8319 RepID=A0AAV7VIT6_PLEWA|nr:hypothetical protein NDU88_003790 [Pleurodeles waltl]
MALHGCPTESCPASTVPNVASRASHVFGTADAANQHLNTQTGDLAVCRISKRYGAGRAAGLREMEGAVPEPWRMVLLLRTNGDADT